MKLPNHFRLICVLTGLAVPVLNAKDFTAYRLGNVVGADIIAPGTLDVVDPAATAALQSAEALKTPAIFRDWTTATNVLAVQLQTAFDAARSNFISSIQDTFHQTVLDHATITSPDFDYLVTAFNITHKKFPVPSALAMDWAYGKTGDAEKNKLFGPLLQSAQQLIRPDDLPTGFASSETWRLISVSNRDETLLPENAETRGQMVPQTNLITLSQAQMAFRRQFNNFDEQPLARALAAWLQPDCLPDAALTQSVRARAVRQLVVSEHYAAGQTIARQGVVVDEKIRAALEAMQGKSTAPPLNPLDELPAAAAIDDPPTKNQNLIPTPVVTVASSPKPDNVALPKNWLAAGVMAVSAFVLVMSWRWVSRRRRATPISPVTKDLPWQTPMTLQTELAPQLIRIVREAFIQELAGQRHDLLLAQRNAAAEVIRLVHRMDGLQVAMQERLQAYESQIQKLETELAARTEENREQIKLKIQMIRHQMEAESHGKRIELN